MWAYEQTMGDLGGSAGTFLYYVMSVLMAAAILGGFALGVMGIVGGLRRRAGPTVALACLGLLMNGAAITLSIVAAIVVMEAARLSSF